MKIKYYFMLVLWCLLASNVHAQHTVSLEFTLKGEKFDSLHLATLDEKTYRVALFYGKTDDQCTWRFEIPNELWRSLKIVVLGNSNEKKRIYEYVQFLYKSSKDSKAVLPKNWNNIQITPDWDSFIIKAIYLKTDTVHEGRKTLIYHDFKLTPAKFSSMEACVKYPYFSSFKEKPTNKDSLKLYNQHLNEYVQIAKEYPDSRLLIDELLENLTNYRSVEDARAVYNCFSKKNKASFFGEEIEHNFMQDWTKFKDIALQNVLNNKEERIVQDSTKYTLVCFTASWCSPCKAEVPLLKQVYNDLKNDPFEIVSVSVDDKSTVPTFREEVINDSIPWRCLSAYPVDILKEYAIQRIPVNILVFPDKHMKIMDIREADNKKKLYEYVHNRENYLN